MHLREQRASCQVCTAWLSRTIRYALSPAADIWCVRLGPEAKRVLPIRKTSSQLVSSQNLSASSCNGIVGSTRSLLQFRTRWRLTGMLQDDGRKWDGCFESCAFITGYPRLVMKAPVGGVRDRWLVARANGKAHGGR